MNKNKTMPKATGKRDLRTGRENSCPVFKGNSLQNLETISEKVESPQSFHLIFGTRKTNLEALSAEKKL